VIGAEQMSIVVNHDSMVDFDSGSAFTASSSNTGAGFIKMVTILRAENGTDIGKWETPQDVEIPLATLLDMIDVDLDTINPATFTSTVTGNQAYYRMTGVQIVLDMDYKNFDVDGIDTLDEGTDDVMYCVMTPKHVGVWESLGSETAEYTTPSNYVQRAGSNMYDYETQLIDRYRQGIKVSFSPHGSIGQVDWYLIFNQLINGVVLIGVATKIVTFIAKYMMCCLPGFEGFGAIFKRYQDAECRPNMVICRSATVAAATCSQFRRSFDPENTGKLDIKYLYDTLTKMFHKDLNPKQIAKLCKDIMNKADVNEDNDIEVDEFVHFISADNCDLNNIIHKYEQLDGDAEFLATIPDLDIDNHKSQVTGIETELEHTRELAANVPDGGASLKALDQAILAVKASTEVTDYSDLVVESPTKTDAQQNQDLQMQVGLELEQVPEPKKNQL